MSELEQVTEEMCRALGDVCEKQREGRYTFINIVCRTDAPGFTVGITPLPRDPRILIGLLRSVAAKLESSGCTELDLDGVLSSLSKEKN